MVDVEAGAGKIQDAWFTGTTLGIILREIESIVSP
jgi:hypothetical protein